MTTYKQFIPTKDGLSAFVLVFDGACLRENKHTYGFSHLIEHLIASKLRKYENKFNEVGIGYNACTSNDQILYYITGLDEGVCKYKHLLIKIVKEGLNDLTVDLLENEKKIVRREYEMQIMRPLTAHIELLGRREFNIVSPAGTLEGISNADIDSIKKFFNEIHRNIDAIIDISSTDNSEQLIRKYYDNNICLTESYDQSKRFKITKARKDVDKKDICQSYWPETTSIIAAFKVGYTAMPYMELAAKVLGSGLSSPLYDEIRIKQNLAYAIYSQVYKVSKDFGIFLIAFEVETNRVEEARRTLFKILNSPKRYMRLTRFKSICKVIEAKNKISNIRVTDDPTKYLDYENSVDELIEKRLCAEILLGKTLRMFEHVVTDVHKHIYTYQGNEKNK